MQAERTNVKRSNQPKQPLPLPEENTEKESREGEIREEEEREALAEPSEVAQGHHWLRHFGVSTSRRMEAGAKNSSKKIFGSDVTSLGSLEAEILGLLWEIGKPANGMDVAEAALYRRRSQGQEPIAFSTVNTTLRRLTDKGLLASQKGEARTPYYTPTVGREEMAARILNNVSQTLLGRSLHGLIPKLGGGLKQNVPDSTAEQEELARLMQALEQAAQPPPASLPPAKPETSGSETIQSDPEVK